MDPILEKEGEELLLALRNSDDISISNWIKSSNNVGVFKLVSNIQKALREIDEDSLKGTKDLLDPLWKMLEKIGFERLIGILSTLLLVIDGFKSLFRKEENEYE